MRPTCWVDFPGHNGSFAHSSGGGGTGQSRQYNGPGDRRRLARTPSAGIDRSGNRGSSTGARKAPAGGLGSRAFTTVLTSSAVACQTARNNAPSSICVCRCPTGAGSFADADQHAAENLAEANVRNHRDSADRGRETHGGLPPGSGRWATRVARQALASSATWRVLGTRRLSTSKPASWPDITEQCGTRSSTNC